MHNKFCLLFLVSAITPTALILSSAAHTATTSSKGPAPAWISVPAVHVSHFTTDDGKITEDHQFTEAEKSEINARIAAYESFKKDSLASASAETIESEIVAVKTYREKLEKNYTKLSGPNAKWFADQMNKCLTLEQYFSKTLRQKKLALSPLGHKRSSSRSQAMSVAKYLAKAKKKRVEAQKAWKEAFTNESKKEADLLTKMQQQTETIEKLNLAQSKTEEIALLKKQELEKIKAEAAKKLQEAQQILAVQAALAKAEEDRIAKINADIDQLERDRTVQLVNIRSEHMAATMLKDNQAMMLASIHNNIAGLQKAKEDFLTEQPDEDQSPDTESRDPYSSEPTATSGSEESKNGGCVIQ